MGEHDNVRAFNAILESEDESVDLIRLSEIAANFSEEEKSQLDWDLMQDYLDGIDPNKLSKDERNAVINLAKLWTHFICTLFYTTASDLFDQSQLKTIAQLPDCEEDNGRSDSCFGVHFFVTLQQQVTDEVFNLLLEREHYDPGFFPWLIARNPNTSSELLERIASAFTNEFSWRVPGYYTEENFLIEDEEHAKSFVLFQIAHNPNTPESVKKRFAEKIASLVSIHDSNQDLQPADIQEMLEKIQLAE